MAPGELPRPSMPMQLRIARESARCAVTRRECRTCRRSDRRLLLAHPYPAEPERNRPAQEHAAGTVPSNGDVAAVAGHAHRIVEQPAPDAVDDRTARTRSRTERHAAAALPDAQANMRAIDDLNEMHVGFLRKQRMRFDGGAECRDVDRAEIVDEKRAMRVAHVAGGRRAGQRQREGVECVGDRHVPPAGERRAHLDGDQAVRLPRTHEITAAGPQHERRHAGFPHQLPCDAARCAAAGVERRAVGVPERDAGRRVVAVRHDGKLVEADTAVPVAHASHEVAVDTRQVFLILTAQVDDDEVVAVCVHLLKSDRHGGSGRETGEHCTWPAVHDQSRAGRYLLNRHLRNST
ncbi:hypothetical protein BC2230_80065 [Burkholderia cepacia]